MLKADRIYKMGSVSINEFLLTKHNPNGIDMPKNKITDLIGITIHNTDRIVTAAETTPAEQYTRATLNGNMKDVRVHFYVDDKAIWQNLPLNLQGWHAADDTGNAKTISIEIIMNGSGDAKDKKAEENGAKLAAELLKKYRLTTKNLYTHNHWYSKKYCPAYILPHWDSFKKSVEKFMSNEKILDSSGYKKLDSTIGSLALKQMLLIAKEKGLQPYNMDSSYTFGNGTLKAVNYLLKKWGYPQNGIAGKNFIKRLASEIKKKG